MPHQSVGATTTGTSCAASWAPSLHTPSHRMVSTPTGRWGPCCSIEATGNTTVALAAALARRSSAVNSCHRTELDILPPCGRATEMSAASWLCYRTKLGHAAIAERPGTPLRARLDRSPPGVAVAFSWVEDKMRRRRPPPHHGNPCVFARDWRRNGTLRAGGIGFSPPGTGGRHRDRRAVSWLYPPWPARQR